MNKNKFFILIISFIISFQSLRCQTNTYLINAIKEAVIEYQNKEELKSYKTTEYITTLKIMKLKPVSGEFVLNSIRNDGEYDYLMPTYYIHIKNKLVLIVIDKNCKANIDSFGIERTNNEIKKEALNILAGPGLIITGKNEPYMFFKYKKDKVAGKLFLTESAPRKYWF